MEAGREDVSLVNSSVCRVEGDGGTLVAGKLMVIIIITKY